MNVILEKDGQQFEYKVGPALYLLFGFVPFIGQILVLVMEIMRKQFRGIFLNEFVVAVIITVLTIVTMLISVALGSNLLISLLYFVLVAFSIYMYVIYVINANALSVRQRLEEGYKVVNMDNPDVAAFVQKAEATKVPFFQITKF